MMLLDESMMPLEESPTSHGTTAVSGHHPLPSPPVFRGRGAGGEGEEIPRPDSNPPAMRIWFVIGLVILTGLLILAHGCHGDEDHELFSLLTSSITH